MVSGLSLTFQIKSGLPQRHEDTKKNEQIGKTILTYYHNRYEKKNTPLLQYLYIGVLVPSWRIN